MSNLYHKRLPEFESFDEIRLKVVPRYKESELSGDEWRQHVRVEFLFKGQVVHEAGWSRMQAALMLLPGEWIKAQEPIPSKVIEIEKMMCDQPSCCAEAVYLYALKEQFSQKGDKLDAADQHSKYYRQFCERHKIRGDCGREDSDSNYEAVT